MDRSFHLFIVPHQKNLSPISSGVSIMCFRGLSLRGMAVRCARLKLSIGLIVATGILSASPLTSSVRAQGLFGGIRVVGGVSISPEGVLRTATQEDQTLALSEMRAQLIGPQGQLNQ
ncbi:MAG: hypothetical protein K9M08_02895, partial [Pirellula sp.]|nr:hypothetical protein [Pirellula sp.]